MSLVKPSWPLVPTPKIWAKAAVDHIGKTSMFMVTPYWFHNIFEVINDALPYVLTVPMHMNRVTTTRIRALRKKEGKDWGYVILPVIYDGETNEIDNENFNDILSIVRGLAANDERIIEYFKDKSLPKGGQKSGGTEVFSMISETLSESDFAEQLNIRIWEKLSKFNWMPFEEAREYLRSLNLKNQDDFWEKRRDGKISLNIPSSPNKVYKNTGWVSYPDFLGYESLFRKLLDYEEAKKLVHSFNLKGMKDWRDMDKLKMPSNIPKRPVSYYKDKGWISAADWFGKE